MRTLGFSRLDFKGQNKILVCFVSCSVKKLAMMAGSAAHMESLKSCYASGHWSSRTWDLGSVPG